jgi:hypothetical protein
MVNVFGRIYLRNYIYAVTLTLTYDKPMIKQNISTYLCTSPNSGNDDGNQLVACSVKGYARLVFVEIVLDICFKFKMKHLIDNNFYVS